MCVRVEMKTRKKEGDTIQRRERERKKSVKAMNECVEIIKKRKITHTHI